MSFLSHLSIWFVAVSKIRVVIKQQHVSKLTGLHDFDILIFRFLVEQNLLIKYLSIHPQELGKVNSTVEFLPFENRIQQFDQQPFEHMDSDQGHV